MYFICVSVSDSSGKVHSRSSQLSKSLDEVLRDKDALAYFISYLQSVNADSLVRFWLDAEAFRLAAQRTPSIDAVRFPANSATGTETFRLAAVRMPAVEAVQLTADSTPPTTNCKPVVKTTSLADDVVCSKTPEVTQQRVPTNDCGHASSSVSNSPKAIGRVPAHGEVIVSTDTAAVPPSSVDPSRCGRSPVDCCPASNPSVTVVSHSSQLLAEQQTSEALASPPHVEESLVTSSEHVSDPPPHEGFTLSFCYV